LKRNIQYPTSDRTRDTSNVANRYKRSYATTTNYHVATGCEVEMIEYPGKTGVAQGVESINGVKKAICDLRGDGIPMGF